MEKKFMNKLGNMELNMVAGGRKKRVDGIKNGENHLSNKTERGFDAFKKKKKNFFKKVETKLTPPTKCPI